MVRHCLSRDWRKNGRAVFFVNLELVSNWLSDHLNRSTWLLQCSNCRGSTRVFFRKIVICTHNLEMFSLQSVSSLRGTLIRGTKCLPAVQIAVVKMSTSSDPQDPSFTKMCEGFFENARSYVEHRLLTKPDPPGYRSEKFEDKKHRIKGKIAQQFHSSFVLPFSVFWNYHWHRSNELSRYKPKCTICNTCTIPLHNKTIFFYIDFLEKSLPINGNLKISNRLVDTGRCVIPITLWHVTSALLGKI